MEPNKMEVEFRKKLNEREIAPSQASWDRLDAMLSVAEKNPPMRSYRWLYIAAGIAIFFCVGLFLFRQEKAGQGLDMDKEGVVSKDKSEEQIQDAAGGKTLTNPEIIEVISASSIVESNGGKQKTGAKTERLEQKVVRQEVVQAIPEVKQQIEKQESVDNKEQQQLAVLDQPKEKPQVKVNANALLSSVEGELNQEFRETTLQKLNRNFKTVKTAVANRNHE